MSTVTRRPPRRVRLAPHQHGAWAFLIFPVALGVTESGWFAELPVLVAAWVAGYPLLWGVGESLSARRPAPYRRAAGIWAAVVIPLAVVLVVREPWVVWFGAFFAAVLAVNLTYARAGAERSLVNDLALVAGCAAMVPLVAAFPAGDGGWAPPWDAMSTGRVGVLVAVCVLTLVGSTLHVKSLIRERADPRFRALSRSFALVCLPIAVALAMAWGHRGAVLVSGFVLLAGRAWVPDMRGWRPARVGLVELAALLVVAGSVVLAA